MLRELLGQRRLRFTDDQRRQLTAKGKALRRRVGLVRHVVFFVMDLPTRKVEVTGVAPIPDGFWMAQVARNLIEGVAETNSGRITRRERLGGILSHSYRDAA